MYNLFFTSEEKAQKDYNNNQYFKLYKSGLSVFKKIQYLELETKIIGLRLVMMTNLTNSIISAQLTHIKFILNFYLSTE